MKIGIYTRLLKGESTAHFYQLKTGFKCMWLHGFDGYKHYAEYLEEESEDVTNRPRVNQMLYDAEIGEIDAMYVIDLSAFCGTPSDLNSCGSRQRPIRNNKSFSIWPNSLLHF